MLGVACYLPELIYDNHQQDWSQQISILPQGIYNLPGIKCKNGRLEIAARIIDRFYLVDKIFAQFF